MRYDLTPFVRPGDGVLIGQGCAEPQRLVELLVAQRDAFSGASVFLGAHYSGIIKPEHTDHLRLRSYCGAGSNRTLLASGALDIQVEPYSRIASLIRTRAIRADVVMIQVSHPNARGEFSLGLAADYLVPAIEVARAVIGEVNHQVPWTYAERPLHRNEFALLVASSRAPATPPLARRDEKRYRAIARHAAARIPGSSTLQFGAGALPDAVCAELAGRTGFTVHSGTASDEVAALVRRGAVSTVDCAMLNGTRKIFDTARENPAIRIRSSEYIHSPRVLARFDRLVAVNAAMEADLTGSVNAEVSDGDFVGTVGGALDFVRAANQSPEGISIVLLPATTEKRRSSIVARLSGATSTPHCDAGIIVTEYGAADLRGCSLKERVRRMIEIAAPAEREPLESQAQA